MNTIHELRNGRKDLVKTDYAVMSKFLDSILPRIPLSVLDFKNRKFELKQQTGGLNLLYRARIIENKEPHNLVQDLSYIPKEKTHLIVKHGRANKPGQSMFYSSTSLEAACIETFSKGENRKQFLEKGSLMIAVGVWEIIEPMTFIHMTSQEKYFEEFLQKANNLQLKKVTIETIREQNAYLKKLIADDQQFEILEFFSEEFAKLDITEHTDYKLSNYFADRALGFNPSSQTPGQADGIWYPSVPSSYQETNIVIPPHIVDTKLKFVGAIRMWVVHFRETSRTQFIPIEQHVLANEIGEIQWRHSKV